MGACAHGGDVRYHMSQFVHEREQFLLRGETDTQHDLIAIEAATDASGQAGIADGRPAAPGEPVKCVK